MAKKLGRNWIGIERDERYIGVAQERIDAVAPAPAEALVSNNPRQQKRIPFGALLEAGLLQPGETLYFVLVNVPCNGWDMWLHEDRGGKKAPIDKLRKILREEIGPENEG